MTDKKDDANKGQTPGASPAKKPTPIIDLKATVVDTGKTDTGKTDAAKTDAAKVDASKTADAVRSGASSTVEIKPASSGASAASTSVPSAKPTDVKASDAKPAASTSSAAASASASATQKPADAARAAATASTPSPQRAMPPARTSGGFFSHMAAGVTGAVLALVGAQGVLPMLGLDSGAGVPTELTRRLETLEKSAAKPTGEVAQKLTASETRLQKLEEAAQALASGQVKIATEAKTLEDKLGQAGSAPTDATQRLAKLEEQLSQMTAAANADPRNAGRIPQLAQLTTKIGEVETALTTRTAQLKSELMQQMEQRFAKTGETVETTRSLLSQRTQSVEQTLKTVTDETAAIRSGVDALKADVDQRLRATAKPADVQSAVAAVTTKVTSLEQNMQNVVKSEQDRNATAGNILLSLELANLKRALDRGGKYSSELAAVRGLAGPKLDLAVLEANQEKGVPSLATLGGELSGLAHAMLDAEAEPTDASLSDRMLSGFKSIVRVRKVSFEPGDKSTEAVIARMENGLKEGRLADVIAEAKALPPKAATPASAWLKKIESRAAIDKAMTDLDASLKTSLAGGASPKKGTN